MGTCKGKNCGCTDSISHSPECRIEHCLAYSGLTNKQTDSVMEQVAEEITALTASLASTNSLIETIRELNSRKDSCGILAAIEAHKKGEK